MRQLCDRAGSFRRRGFGDRGPTSLELPARFSSPMDLANVKVPDLRRPRDGLSGGGEGSGEETSELMLLTMEAAAASLLVEEVAAICVSSAVEVI